MKKGVKTILYVGLAAIAGYLGYTYIKNKEEEEEQNGNNSSSNNVLDLPFPIIYDEGQQYDERVLLMQQFLNDAIEINEDGLTPIQEDGFYTNQFRNRFEYYMVNYIYDDYLDEQIIEIGYNPEITTGNGDFITEELYTQVVNNYE